jgi:hypothetical protein
LIPGSESKPVYPITALCSYTCFFRSLVSFLTRAFPNLQAQTIIFYGSIISHGAPISVFREWYKDQAPTSGTDSSFPERILVRKLRILQNSRRSSAMICHRRGASAIRVRCRAFDFWPIPAISLGNSQCSHNNFLLRGASNPFRPPVLTPFTAVPWQP